MRVNLRVTWEVSWELAWEGSPELGILEQTWLPEWKEVCLPSWALRLCQLSGFSEFWMACECFGRVSRTKKKITLLSSPYLRTFFSQLSKSRRRGGVEYSISPPHKSCFFFLLSGGDIMELKTHCYFRDSLIGFVSSVLSYTELGLKFTRLFKF